MIEGYNIWFIIIGMAIGSFGLRFAFLGLVGDRELPEWLLRHLRYTAVAILPGLVAPLVIWPEATGGALDLPRMTAAVVTLAVGYFSRSFFWAIGAGAVVLYVGLWLTGA